MLLDVKKACATYVYIYIALFNTYFAHTITYTVHYRHAFNTSQLRPSPDCIAEFCFLCLGHNDRLLFLIARVVGERMEENIYQQYVSISNAISPHLCKHSWHKWHQCVAALCLQAHPSSAEPTPWALVWLFGGSLRKWFHFAHMEHDVAVITQGTEKCVARTCCTKVSAAVQHPKP